MIRRDVLLAVVVVALSSASVWMLGNAVESGRLDVMDGRWSGEMTRSSSLTLLMLLFTSLGDWRLLVAVLAAVGWARRAWSDSLWLGGMLLAAALVDMPLKAYYHRARPVSSYVQTEYFSFPSGHAMTSICFYGFLAYLLARGRGWRAAPWVVVCAVTVLAVGYSRVYLQAHYPTDVLGAWMAGLGVLAVTVTARAHLGGGS